METIRQAELQSIKDSRFALLPPRIGAKDDKKEDASESNVRKYDVQCQICGRMGVMSIPEMQNHFHAHEEAAKTEKIAEPEQTVVPEQTVELEQALELELLDLDEEGN